MHSRPEISTSCGSRKFRTSDEIHLDNYRLPGRVTQILTFLQAWLFYDDMLFLRCRFEPLFDNVVSNIPVRPDLHMFEPLALSFKKAVGIIELGAIIKS